MWRFLVLSSSLDFCQEPYHWPLLIYLLLVCLYPFASSCAHTFSSMSARARHICYFCDYGALSLYSLGEPRSPGVGPARGWGGSQGCGQGQGAAGPVMLRFSCRLCLCLWCLRDAGPLGQRRFASLFCPGGCFEFLRLHRPLLLLPVCSGQKPQRCRGGNQGWRFPPPQLWGPSVSWGGVPLLRPKAKVLAGSLQGGLTGVHAHHPPPAPPPQLP